MVRASLSPSSLLPPSLSLPLVVVVVVSVLLSCATNACAAVYIKTARCSRHPNLLMRQHSMATVLHSCFCWSACAVHARPQLDHTSSAHQHYRRARSASPAAPDAGHAAATSDGNGDGKAAVEPKTLEERAIEALKQGAYIHLEPLTLCTHHTLTRALICPPAHTLTLNHSHACSNTHLDHDLRPLPKPQPWNRHRLLSVLTETAPL